MREREKEHRTQFILYSAGKIKNINVKADVSHSYFVLESFKVDLLKAVIVWLQAVYCDKRCYKLNSRKLLLILK